MAGKPNSKEGAPKSGRKTLIIGLVAAVLLAGGGAAAWVLTRPAADDAEQADAGSAPAKKKATFFVPLDQFTVNLADEGGERMAQVGITLEVADSNTETAIKARMPAVRNSILLLLSSSHSATLLTVAGKQNLGAQIAELTGAHLGWQAPVAPPALASAAGQVLQPQVIATGRPRPNPVEAVHFSHFIIQ